MHLARVVLPLLIVADLFLIGASCNDDPCARYVDYMCDCHADDPDFSCADLQASLQDADPDVKDQCALDLADQQDQDEDDGLECDAL